MKSVGNTLTTETVADHLLDYLVNAYGAQPAFRVTQIHPPRHMPWSTIYFIDVERANEEKSFVLKIPNLDNQPNPDPSLTSADMRVRGKREYNSIIRVYNHFSAQDNRKLRAMRPETYLASINAVVMNYIPYGTLYDNTISPRHLRTARGRQLAIERLHTAGEWIGWLHQLQVENISPTKMRNVSQIYTEIIDQADNLAGRAIHLQKNPLWQPTLDILSQIDDATGVWIHNDYHMRNVMVSEKGTVLTIDTVLDAIDSPCADLAKFCVDLQTRRWRVLTRGVIPPEYLINRLIESFLQGYQVTGRAVSPLTLALYEGQYLLEKWNQSLDTIQTGIDSRIPSLAQPVSRAIVSPLLSRLTQRWMKRVHALAS